MILNDFKIMEEINHIETEKVYENKKSLKIGSWEKSEDREGRGSCECSNKYVISVISGVL